MIFVSVKSAAPEIVNVALTPVDLSLPFSSPIPMIVRTVLSLFNEKINDPCLVNSVFVEAL